jgi:formylglycine-generating enzyme required for sulfatase activity
MKKTVIALMAACSLIACGNSQKSDKQAADTDSTAVAKEDEIDPDVPEETGVIEYNGSKLDLGTGEWTVNGVHYDFAYVKGGTFTMGAAADDADAADEEKPAHKVTITKGYYIGKTEVTVGFWKAVMGSNPPGNLELTDNDPVQNVSWEQCEEFIATINAKFGAELLDWCLPTEAEWEFAARGGNKSKGYKYSGSNNLDDVAWYTSNFYGHDEDAFEGSYPQVALKKPNELGIYDMSGNVDEWCFDEYAEYTDEAQEDPKVEIMGDFRVIRGGNQLSKSKSCRVTRRVSRYGKEDFNPLTGFRLVFKHYQQEDGEEE